MSHHRFVVLVAVALGLAVGCTAEAPLVPVVGVLTWNGKPLANVLIQLAPLDPPMGRSRGPASGVTDASGRFTLSWSDGRPGAPAGRYKVLLADNNLATEEEPGPGGAPRGPVNRIPPALMTPATTPLELVVEPGKTEYPLGVP